MSVPLPVVEQLQASAVAKMIIQQYEEQQNEQMGLLHNRMVAFLSESGASLANTIVVLEILLAEARQQALQKYLGA